MQSKKLDEHRYILRFDPGDRFMGLLLEFAELQHITAAFLSGLGSLTEATIGFYDTAEDHYNWHTITGLHEILSLTGNLSRFEGKPVVHLHLVTGDHDFNTRGGHLKDMVIGATCELMITTMDTVMSRKQSSYKELKTLDL